MTNKEFIDIMNDENIESVYSGNDNTLIGLNIIAKYSQNSCIEGADHDIIYSCDVNTLLKARITKEDALKLKETNWMIRDGDYLAHFV